MSEKEQPELKNPAEMDSASRRDFMKIAGVSALGLAYASPIVETLSRRNSGDLQGGSDPSESDSGTSKESESGSGSGSGSKS
ncbi:MAG: hypothetical protein ACC700_16510 [Anaerolineales bacterium]